MWAGGAGAELLSSCREPDGQLIAPITELDLARSLAQFSILLPCCQVGSCGFKKIRASGRL